MGKINICIVDDHTLFRKALRNLLKTFARVGDVSEADDGKSFIEQCKKKLPHVVLLDLEMPRMNGLETVEYLIPKYPDLKIIILTQHDSEKYMLHMLELGVHSFLLKNTNPKELEKAIHSVMEKDFYHNDLVASLLRRSVKIKTEAPDVEEYKELSEREREIFKMIFEEYSLKEISARLHLAETTIQTHKANLQIKIGVKNTVGLIKFAYEKRLFQPPQP
jgi:two-component system, NarL family, response regulator DegU